MRESRSPTTTLRYLFHAGMPETQFHPWWHEGTVFSRTKVEDTVAMRTAHPLWDEYWDTKRADFSKITVPAYVVASWSDHGLHTRGTLEAYKALGSEQKWLEIHGRKKWAYYYYYKRPERRPAARLLQPLPQGRGHRGHQLAPGRTCPG